jgi:cytochrome P450
MTGILVQAKQPTCACLCCQNANSSPLTLHCLKKLLLLLPRFHRYSEAMISEAQQLIEGPFAAAAAANSKQQQLAPAPSATAAGSAGVRDVYADFNTLTLNITLAALFSIRDDYSNSNSSSSSSNSRAAVIVAAVEKAFSYFAARGATAMVVPEWVPTPDNVAFKEAVQQLDELVYGIIDSRAVALAASSGGGGSGSGSSGSSSSRDLLQALLESVDEGGRPMGRTALRDEVMTLLVAGKKCHTARE